MPTATRNASTSGLLAIPQPSETAPVRIGTLTGFPHRRNGFATPSFAGNSQRRTVNVRLLIRTVVIVVCTIVVVLFIHKHKTTTVAGALLDRARDLREAKQYYKSADYLNRYLSVRPDDERVAIELAETFDLAAAGTGEIQRAVEFYYRAIGLAASSSLPDLRAREPGLRCRLAELLLDLAPTHLELLPAAIDQAGYLPVHDLTSDLSARGWRVVAIARYLLFQEKAAYNSTRNPAWKDASIGLVAMEQPIAEVLERALALAPGNVTLSMTLAHDIYRDPTMARAPTVVGPLPSAELVRRADRVVDTMVETSRHELVRFLRDVVGSPLPLVATGDASPPTLEESTISNSVLREVYRTAEHRMATAPAELQVNARRYVGSKVIELLQSGQLPSVRRHLIDAELEGKEIGRGTLGFFKGSASKKTSITPAEEVVVGNWILEHERNLVKTHLTTPLQTLNRQYVAALLARYAYRTEYNLPGASTDLDNALRQGPDELLAVLLAAQDCRQRGKIASTRGQHRQALDCYQTAIGYYKRAIQLTPLEESIYLALGDVYATCPECSLNDGSGIVGDLGVQGSIVANQPLRVLIPGFCNDIVITPSLTRMDVLPTTVETIQRYARGDKAIVRCDPSTRHLTIDVDPKHTTALTVVKAFTDCAEFGAALDNQADHAMATWEAAKQTIQHETMSVDLRLAEALLANANYVKGDRLIDEIGRTVDALAFHLSATEHRQLRRQISEQCATSSIAQGDYEKGIALLKSSVADRDFADSSRSVRAFQMLGSAYAALGQWKDAAIQLERASTVVPSNANLRVAAASCWVRAGDVELATRQYLHALQIEERPPIRLALACAQLMLRRERPFEGHDLEDFMGNAQRVGDQQATTFLINAANKSTFDISKLFVLSAAYLEQHASDEAVHAVELVLRPKADNDLAAADLIALLNSVNDTGGARL